MKAGIPAIVGLAIVWLTCRASDEAPIATAGNGEAIRHPASTHTYTVTNGDRTLRIPRGMVYISAGSFTFGDRRNATNLFLDDYCIGKFPVTEAEYKAFADDTHRTHLPRHWQGRTYPAGRDNHPIPYVSLDDARDYCAWVSQRTGWQVFIPSAAQWEKAARGTNGNLYPWGNTAGTRYRGGVLTTRFNYNAVTAVRLLTTEASRAVRYNRERSPYFGSVTNAARIAAYDTEGHPSFLAVSSEGTVRGWVNHETWTGVIYTDLFSALNERGGGTSAVGAYADGVSPYGCHDMAGNLWNWTTTLITARNGAESGRRVNEIRGGSWYANGRSCVSVGIGEGRAAKGVYNTVGFRIAMAVP